MKSNRFLLVVVLPLALTMLMLAACGAAATPTANPPTPTAGPKPTLIPTLVPLAITRCPSVAPGTAISVTDKTLNFTCGASGQDVIGLLGVMTPITSGFTIQQAVISKTGSDYSVKSSTTVRVQTIELSDGTRCGLASTAAITATFGGKDATFFCGVQADNTLVLLGPPQRSDSGWTYEKGTLAKGTNAKGAPTMLLSSSDLVPVAALEVTPLPK